jgi:putative intracellular protease/amidase
MSKLRRADGGDYSLAIKAGKLLAHDGDADGDSAANRRYLASSAAVAAYVKGAPSQARPQQQVQAPPVAPGRKLVGVVLYPGFEVLDVFGPVEMWAYVPDFQVVMISEHGGAVKSAQGVSAVAEYSFANAPQLDIMMIPGGVGTRTELYYPAMISFIQTQNEGAATSVHRLGAAGQGGRVEGPQGDDEQGLLLARR